MGFSYSNTTASSNNEVAGINLGIASNYTPDIDTKKNDGEQIISNTTASLDQPERISFRFLNVGTVSTNGMSVKYPAKDRSGVKYNIRIDSCFRETMADNTFVDHPINVALTIQHELTNVIDESVIDTLIARLLGACYDETNKSYRFMAMARGSMIPTHD